ncbi:MAG: 2-oxo acid dehydrogenase subunit E2 [Microbacteriaceae bacterium]|nr:2-oxo acid dehydrogenase subunit E2 [Microbacteriaceae bacterium]
MAVVDFPLPDVGEGLTEAEIVQWQVAVGDVVAINDILVEIETAKSLVDLPSPFAGTIVALLVAEGDTVPVGKSIIQVDAEGAVPGPLHPAPEPAVSVTPAKPAKPSAKPSAAPEPVLVGYGSGGHVTSRRGSRTVAPATTPPPPATSPSMPPMAYSAAAESAVAVLAKPPVRKLAKELGVEIQSVLATGSNGEVTRDDVIRQSQVKTVFRNVATPEWPNEREEYIPVKGVRKAIAAAMVKSKFEAPHVSVFVDVDATRTMDFVKRLKASADFQGIRVSPLLVMARAVVWAVQRNPTVNSSWTDKDIIVHHYVNLGIAAATPRGLIVPNVKEAHTLNLRQLALGLENLTVTARDGKTTVEDMSNGTITITNLGSFGVDTGTPIINPGEVSIVVLGAIKQKPWVVDGQIEARFVTTIGASFDHRVVDGDVASRFLADIASIIEEPALLLD